MAREFSKISPAVWRSKTFQSVPDDERLLHLYLLTCEHQNSAGSFRLPDGYACADLGWDLQRYVSARSCLEQAELIAFDDETEEVFIQKWFVHNPPMNQKHALGTQRVIERIESDRIREMVEEQFEAADAVRERRQQAREQTNVRDLPSPSLSLERRRSDPFSRP
ncbi:hypothetical protein REJC140_03860 [Pseudorhizobium endolithicum]|uniref:Uncharacterized protein n=1 Tax=Pseudorhizobium endolithicum TaxID=1191678 RepID=A0ABN7JRQ8_9HYPH|nr:hypothetical protein [Pseudorhizobium endolithicum]CAD7044735.1 hypothetical protein REJC140_03860 [Pseudorhizobium endolithicum]